MTLTERLTELVRAAFSGIWVQSHEHDDALVEIARLCQIHHWSLATWDVDRGLATGADADEGEALEAVLDAAAGLTRMEAENAFSLSLVRHGRLAPDVLWELKGQALKKSGLLTLHKGGETFADLGGLEALKTFCARALRPGRPPGVRARGVLLLGPPGSGKSALCKAIGNETGRPTLVLDVGALLGSLVG